MSKKAYQVRVLLRDGRVSGSNKWTKALCEKHDADQIFKDIINPNNSLKKGKTKEDLTLAMYNDKWNGFKFVVREGYYKRYTRWWIPKGIYGHYYHKLFWTKKLASYEDSKSALLHIVTQIQPSWFRGPYGALDETDKRYLKSAIGSRIYLKVTR